MPDVQMRGTLFDRTVGALALTSFLRHFCSFIDVLLWVFVQKSLYGLQYVQKITCYNVGP